MNLNAPIINNIPPAKIIQSPTLGRSINAKGTFKKYNPKTKYAKNKNVLNPLPLIIIKEDYFL